MKTFLIKLTAMLGLFGLALPASANPTPKSLEAATFQSGMSRTQIINRLGQADFIVHRSDEGGSAEELRNFAPGVAFELYWANGRCNPVIVQFDAGQSVTGWDEGRAICLDSTYTFLPETAYSCAFSRHSAYCG